MYIDYSVSLGRSCNGTGNLNGFFHVSSNEFQHSDQDSKTVVPSNTFKRTISVVCGTFSSLHIQFFLLLVLQFYELLSCAATDSSWKQKQQNILYIGRAFLQCAASRELPMSLDRTVSLGRSCIGTEILNALFHVS